MVEKNNLSILIRIFSYSILALTLVFLINNVLTVWFEWPGVKKLFAHYELFGFKKLNKPLEELAINLSYTQIGRAHVSTPVTDVSRMPSSA